MQRRRRLLWWLSSLLLVAAWLVAPGLSAAGQASSTAGPPIVPYFWTSECVDCPHWFSAQGSEHALRLDAQGHPHVVYGGNHLYHAWRDETGWHNETVDPAPGVGSLASLAIGSDGVLHVLYLDAAHGQYKYARWAGAQWFTVAVAAAYGLGPAGSLAVDASGQPRIAVLKPNPRVGPNVGAGSLEYGRLVGGTWEFEQVTALQVATGISLALNSSDEPVIAYADNWPDVRQAKLARRSGVKWSSETITGDVTYADVYAISLALGSDGRPQVAYSRTTGGSMPSYRLIYAQQGAAGWQVQTVEQAGGYAPSLTIGRADLPHISYGAGSQQIYTEFDGSTWHKQVVAGLDYGWPVTSSLVLRRQSEVFLAFGHPALTLATQVVAWKLEAIDRSATAGKGNALALDAAGNPHVAYTIVPDGGSAQGGTLVYARWAGDHWVRQTVFEGIADAIDLALDSAGRPHVVYFLWSEKQPYELKHALWNGVTWEIVPVDSVDSTAQVSLALDAADRAHIGYGQYTLKSAHQQGSGWITQTVDVPGSYVDTLSLALDAAQVSSIGYTAVDSTSGWELRYARLAGTSWTTTTVTSGSALPGVSLALDGAGAPHIAYCDVQLGLRYASLKTAGWELQDVSRKGYPEVCSSPALSIDPAGRSHLSYQQYGWPTDAVFGNLLYATPAGSDWGNEVVKSIGNTGGDFYLPTSLATGPDGQPRITSYDHITGGLYLSRRYDCTQRACYQQFLPMVAAVK